MADSKKKSVAGGRNSLNLKPADATRNAILRKQQKQIQDMYANLAKQTAAEAERLKHLAGATPALQSAYLTKLSQRLTAALNDIQAELTGTIKANAQNAAQSVVNAQREYLKNIGMPGFEAAFSHVPRDVVQSLFTGNVYGGNWTPSKSIWGTTKHNIEDINQIVAKGIAENKSSFDIAKELERYVDPKAAKTFDWGKVYPGSYKKIDYNAQRLARTLTAHAYQQSLVNTCAKNPFITGFKWESGHTARTCEICNDRDGQIYSKTDLPLDHPNGTCTWVAVSNASSDEVVDRLANWVNGGKDPDLDVWAKSFQRSPEGATAKSSSTQKKTKDTGSDIRSASKVSDVKKLIDSSGWFQRKTYLQGCDLDSAKAVGTAFDRMFSKFPQLKGKFVAPETGELRKNVYANCRTTTDGGVTLSKTLFSDWGKLKSKYSYDVLLGFHPAGTDASSIVTHEFGHAVDGYIGRALGKETYSETIIKQVLKDAGVGPDKVAIEISKYATKNERECFAELFAEYIGSENPSKAAQALGKSISDILTGVVK